MEGSQLLTEKMLERLEDIGNQLSRIADALDSLIQMLDQIIQPTSDSREGRHHLRTLDIGRD
jgi:hypothetical protein